MSNSLTIHPPSIARFTFFKLCQILNIFFLITRSWIDKRFVKHFNSWKSTSKSHDANWEIGYKAAEKAQALSAKDRLQLITCPISSDDENVNQQSEKSAPKLGRKKSIKAPQPKRRRILFDEHNDTDEDADGEFCDSQNDGTRNFSHLALDWLKPDKIKDGKGRSPQDLDYDSHTLFVPKEFIQNRTPLMVIFIILFQSILIYSI